MNIAAVRKKACAGSMRHRVLVQAEDLEADGAGGFNRLGWSTIFTRYAMIESISGTERYFANRLEATGTDRFYFRYFSGLSEEHRLVFGGNVYNIREIDNVDFRNEFLVVKAEWVKAAEEGEEEGAMLAEDGGAMLSEDGGAMLAE